MTEATPQLAAPDTPPHVTMLIVAHADLCMRLAGSLVALGATPDSVKQVFMDHAETLRQAGAMFGIEAAAADIANGVEVTVETELEGANATSPSTRLS